MTSPIAAAVFLSARVSLIASREDAGDCLREIRGLVESIERAVNRKPSPKYCGNCPTPLDDDQRRKLLMDGEKDRLTCATSLYAENREDIEITCWKCHRTFNIKRLFDDALAEGAGLPLTERECLEIMAHMGRPIPRGTWWSWVKREVLPNRNEFGAEPKYWLEDVQALWDERVGKRKAS